MKKVFALLFLLSVLRPGANGQTSFEVLASLDHTNTPSIAYQNCTGHLSPTYTPSISFIYHPHPSWGFEMTCSSLHPTTYLNDPDNNSVKVYTNSVINMQRLLTGINYSVPFNRIHPYIGCLLGFTHTVTTQTPMTATYTSFSWACQAGTDFYFSSLIGMRLNGAIITTPNIPNNSAYFNVDKNGEGFPTFAVGNPSTAGITQWNISLGIIVRLMKKKEEKL